VLDGRETEDEVSWRSLEDGRCSLVRGNSVEAWGEKRS